MKDRVAMPLFIAVTTVCLAVACSSGSVVNPNIDGKLAIGTWGGDTGGFIVGDTSAHLHIGCTYGDVHGRIALDASGRFQVAGSYMLHAYPVAVGPTMPAVFTGNTNDDIVTVSVMVSDTIQHTTVTRGPVVLRFGDDPRLGPCPICRKPYGQPSVWRRLLNFF